MNVKPLAASAAILTLSAAAHAAVITSFTNLDFDAGVTHIASGFDASGADIPGWTNNGGITDAGVEGPGAWWGPYDQYAAFINGGGSAYNLSDYTIQPGDQFTIAFYAQCWQWLGAGEWTATLFYDTPANVIGTYVTPSLAGHTNWTLYTNTTAIAATPGSIGGKLGILMTSSGAAISQFDELSVAAVPEPASLGLMAAGGLCFLRRRRLVK